MWLLVLLIFAAVYSFLREDDETDEEFTDWLLCEEDENDW